MKNLTAIIFIFLPNMLVAQALNDLWSEAVSQAGVDVIILDSLKSSHVWNAESLNYLDPGKISTKYGNHLIYDFSRRELVSFKTEENKQLSKTMIASSVGRGPGEFQRIRAFDMDNEGNVYALDSDLLRIMVWDAEGDYITTFQETSGIPGELSLWDENIIIKYTSVGNSQYLYGILEKDGTLIRQFYPYSEAMEEPNPLFYEGSIDTDSNKVVYASANFGVFMLHDLEGNQIFCRKMIEPIDGLVMESSQSGNMFITMKGDDSIYATLDVGYSNSKIYILYSGDRTLRGNRIDVYEDTNGNYLGSFILDHHLSKMSVEGDTLYGIVREYDGDDQLILSYDVGF